MQLNFSQQMRMGMKQVLAPRMIQSMEILQLPYQELQERIERELEENVVLISDEMKKDVTDSEAAQVLEKAREEAAEQPLANQELVVDSEHGNDDFERLIEMSADWPDDNFAAEGRPSSNRLSDDQERYDDMMSSVPENPTTLHDSLLEQFGFFDLTVSQHAFGEYLIQNLDNNGRLQSSLAEIVQVYGDGISFDDAQLVLKKVQQLEPTGVGARDLKECLLLQLTDDMMYRDLIEQLIANHLEDLAANRLPVISKKTGFEIDEIKEAVEEMRHLDPYPGRRFQARVVQNVTPDVAVEKDDQQHWQVRVIDEYVPSLRISRKYREMLQNGVDATTKEYIKKKIESAKWLIESIEQRYSTLKKVSQAIVDHQSAFLQEGPEHIQPLKMQQIADQVGVHVTTISRAVDDKWIQTPRGIFPLKRFFAGGTKTATGEDVAWDIIRIKLQELIDKEPKDKPFSDDQLVDEMAKLGYQLARRTVTKYRKKMNIPTARQRKQF